MAMAVAAMWIMASKLVSVLSQRVAILRNGLILAK
jgi:hypothetical protein